MPFAVGPGDDEQTGRNRLEPKVTQYYHPSLEIWYK
jgi:hypothetical protein